MKQLRLCGAALLLALAFSAQAATKPPSSEQNARMITFNTSASAPSVSAFSDSWVMTINANVGGSYTLPSISASDSAQLLLQSIDGMLGFVAGGELEVGYIWSTSKAFGLREGHPFSGIGVFFDLGISQGYAGQVATTTVNGETINAYVNIYYTPVISVGATGKAYFFNNRMAVGLSLGTKIICDTAPEYSLYSKVPDIIPEEVGTVIVSDWMMSNMNPFMFYIKPSIEYVVPILPTLQLNLGGYLAFSVYKPKYITMPDTLMAMLLLANPDFDMTAPLNSYYLNAFDFGIIVGLNFKL